MAAREQAHVARSLLDQFLSQEADSWTREEFHKFAVRKLCLTPEYLDICWDEERNVYKANFKCLRKWAEANVSPSQSKYESLKAEYKLDTSTETKSFARMLERLDLKKWYPGKLTTNDILKIDDLSLQTEPPQTEKDIAMYVIKRLFMADFKARDVTLEPCCSPVAAVTENVSIFSLVSELRVASISDESAEFKIDGMDILMCLYHCCDSILQQEFVTKMYLCKLALPFIVPCALNSKLTVPIWSFRKLRESFRERWQSYTEYSRESFVGSSEEYLLNIKSPVITFLKMDEKVSLSKSEILNCMLYSSAYDTFFSRNCKSYKPPAILRNGLAEIAWYLPRGGTNDNFNQAITFVNFRGHATSSQPQIQFLKNISDIFVILSETSVHSQYEELLRCLDKHAFIWLAGGGATKDIKRGNKCVIATDSGMRNTKETARELLEKIKLMLKMYEQNTKDKKNKLTLEHRILKAIDPSFVNEENNRQEMRQHIRSIMTFLETAEQNLKTNNFPLQDLYWQTWCHEYKEWHRLLKFKQNSDIMSVSQYKSTLDEQMNKIRFQQNAEAERTFQEGSVTTKLIRLLKDQSKLCYVITYISLHLDQFCLQNLPKLKSRHVELLENYRKNKVTLSERDKRTQKDEIQAVETKICQVALGFEHVLREIGQMFEAAFYCQNIKIQAPLEYNQFILALPKIAANIILAGNPFEIMDGDVGFVPREWIQAVFIELSTALGDAKLYVVTIIGMQSSGKSTLLNTMFGARFAVSSGRCTKGAFMQLIEVDSSTAEKVGYKYVMLIDTEGLRAPNEEKTMKLRESQDLELATFIIGLGDLTIVNILGENPVGMDNFLEMAVLAFLRMKSVHLNPKCCIVYQNVGDVTAPEKTAIGRLSLQLKLDEMVNLAIKGKLLPSTAMSTSPTTFESAMEFDMKEDIAYLPSPWQGSPPMAPPNPDYSMEAQKLKQKILISERKQSYLNINEISEKLNSLWNALLQENFVFAFENKLEICANRKLETHIQCWLLQLKNAYITWEQKIQNEIRNSKDFDISDTSRFTTSIHVDLNKMKGKINAKIEQYFANVSSPGLLLQWKDDVVERINNQIVKLQKDADIQVHDFLTHRTVQLHTDHQKPDHQKCINDFKVTFEKECHSQFDLQNNFDAKWQQFVEGFQENNSTKMQPALDSFTNELFKVLQEHFSHHQNTLYCKVKEANLYRDFSKFTVDPRQHFHNATGKFKRFWKMVNPFSDLTKSNKATKLSDEILKKVKGDLEKLEGVFSANAISGPLLHSIADSLKASPLNEKLSPEFEIDLALTACSFAEEVYFRNYSRLLQEASLKVYFNDQKQSVYNRILEKYNGRPIPAENSLEIVLAEKLGVLIKQEVADQISTLAVKMMLADPVLQNSQYRGLAVLKDLLQTNSFAKYEVFLYSPRTFVETWAEEYVKLKYSSRDAFTQLEETMKFIYMAIDKQDRCCDWKTWFQQFVSALHNTISFNEDTVKYIQERQINDIERIVTELKHRLETVHKSMTAELNTLTLSSWLKPRHLAAIQQHMEPICWELCPLCKTYCTLPEGHHGEHESNMHRPRAIAGGTWSVDGVLDIDACSSCIGTKDMVLPQKDSEYQSFSDYIKTTSWRIRPASNDELYWKWFICNYKRELEIFHNCSFSGRSEIPQQWFKIAKENVLHGLDKEIFLLLNKETIV